MRAQLSADCQSPNALGELKCGVWVIDIDTGGTVAFLEFEAGVTELFDIQVLPNVHFPAIIGLQKNTIHDVFVILEKLQNDAIQAKTEVKN